MSRPRRMLASVAAIAMTTVAACSHRTSSPRVDVTHRVVDRCAHDAAQGPYDGPLDWEMLGTEIADRPWGASQRALDVGDIPLLSPKTIVLDSVTIDPQSPAYFSPLRLLGQWISTDTGHLGDFEHWPTPLHRLRCFVVAPESDTGDAPVLVVQLMAAARSRTEGRRWSANRGIVLNYHTLDGHEYSAPFGLVNIYPNARGVDTWPAHRYLAPYVDSADGAVRSENAPTHMVGPVRRWHSSSDMSG